MIKGLTEAIIKSIIREFPVKLKILAARINNEEFVQLLD